MIRVLIWLVSFCWLWNTVTSFSITSSDNSNCKDRRSFLDAVIGIAAASVVVGASPVFAAGEVDDLAMPTGPETKDVEVRTGHIFHPCFSFLLLFPIK